MISLFRWIGLAEGLSYLLLLGVAMPLKYVWGMPETTRLVGAAHGALFIAYVALATLLAYRRPWPVRVLLYSYVASVLPFGTFVFQRKYGSRY